MDKKIQDNDPVLDVFEVVGECIIILMATAVWILSMVMCRPLNILDLIDIALRKYRDDMDELRKEVGRKR